MLHFPDNHACGWYRMLHFPDNHACGLCTQPALAYVKKSISATMHLRSFSSHLQVGMHLG
jgi:hypothetical protein